MYGYLHGKQGLQGLLFFDVAADEHDGGDAEYDYADEKR